MFLLIQSALGKDIVVTPAGGAGYKAWEVLKVTQLVKIYKIIKMFSDRLIFKSAQFWTRFVYNLSRFLR